MQSIPFSNNKNCERCHRPFVCNTANVSACACSKIELTIEETQYIAAQYSDCVCNTCLLHLKDEFLSR